MAQEFNEESIKIWRQRAISLFPSFSSVISTVDIGFDRSGTSTAEAAKGKINVCKSFMSGLSESEQLFVIMHEVCHIAFGHVADMARKEPKYWNIACDAVINAWLKERGMTLPNDAIYMPDALGCDNVEVLYKELVKRDKNGERQPYAKKAVSGKKEREWQEFDYAVDGTVDDHGDEKGKNSGWVKEAEEIKKGEVKKPKKLLYPEKKAFLVNEETLNTHSDEQCLQARAVMEEMVASFSANDKFTTTVTRSIDVAALQSMGYKDGAAIQAMKIRMQSNLDAMQGISDIERHSAQSKIDKLFSSTVEALRLRHETELIYARIQELTNLDFQARNALDRKDDKLQ